jgi:hypothetical protein
VNLNDLEKSALAAAMRGGTSGWGQVASVVRACAIRSTGGTSLSPPLSLRMQSAWRHTWVWQTGIGLVTGCALSIQRWVRTGRKRP